MIEEGDFLASDPIAPTEPESAPPGAIAPLLALVRHLAAAPSDGEMSIDLYSRRRGTELYPIPVMVREALIPAVLGANTFQGAMFTALTEALERRLPGPGGSPANLEAWLDWLEAIPDFPQEGYDAILRAMGITHPSRTAAIPAEEAFASLLDEIEERVRSRSILVSRTASQEPV